MDICIVFNGPVGAQPAAALSDHMRKNRLFYIALSVSAHRYVDSSLIIMNDEYRDLIRRKNTIRKYAAQEDLSEIFRK